MFCLFASGFQTILKQNSLATGGGGNHHSFLGTCVYSAGLRPNACSDPAVAISLLFQLKSKSFLNEIDDDH